MLAAGLFALLMLPSAVGNGPGWPQLALGVVMFAALVFRRVRPVESFAVVALAGRVVLLADGRLAGQITEPTADSVLAGLRGLGA